MAIALNIACSRLRVGFAETKCVGSLCVVMSAMKRVDTDSSKCLKDAPTSRSIPKIKALSINNTQRPRNFSAAEKLYGGKWGKSENSPLCKLSEYEISDSRLAVTATVNLSIFPGIIITFANRPPVMDHILVILRSNDVCGNI